jgi:hypothetical protein
MLRLWVQVGLRALSSGALWVAILTASFIILRHAVPLVMESPLPISLKSGVPLMAIGISYCIFILTVRRTPGQRLVGIFMGLAFVLWGLEQFLRDRALISFIDDVVVFLFVVDLSIVIRQSLKSGAGERQLHQTCFPVVKTVQNFKFIAQSSVDEHLLRTLLQGKYIERRENVIIVGLEAAGEPYGKSG